MMVRTKAVSQLSRSRDGVLAADARASRRRLAEEEEELRFPRGESMGATGEGDATLGPSAS